MYIRRTVLALGLVLAATACTTEAPQQPARLQQERPVLIAPPAQPGVDGPIGVATIDTPAPAWQGGAAAQVRTTADIMAEAARTPPAVVDWQDRPHARKIRPDRRDLPQNPLSPDLPGGQAPGVAARGAAPSIAQTAASPNVDVATLADTNALPPDTMGDVGPTQYLVGLNGRLRTISKATGVKDNVLDVDTDVFFSGVSGGAFTSDPRVRYDRRTGRWFVIMISVAVPNRFVLAVSSTGSITGGTSWAYHVWVNTRTQGGVGGAAGCLADYPTLGIDEDALYIGVNQFCGSSVNSLTFDSTSAYVVNKPALVGNSLSVSQFDAVLPTGGSPGIYTPQGVDNFDSGTNQGYFIGIDNVSAGTLVVKRVASPTASPSLSADIVVPVATTSFPLDVPHPGSAVPLDGLDDRLLQAVIRNGRLWTTHQVRVSTSGVASGAGTRNGIRWYELQNLSASVSVAQSGTVFDATAANPIHYWMGAIMPNGQQHVALGMSKAGATTRVNTAFTGRLRTDSAGAMDAPTQYSANTSFSYNVQPSASTQRWGDYSYTSVDPNDDMTFWTLQQYVQANDSYAVRLVKLLAPAPAVITAVSPSTVPTGLSNVQVTVTGAATGGRGFFDPGAGFAQRPTASVSGGGVVVTGVVVNSPTSMTLTLNTTGAAAGARTLTITNPDGQSSTLASAITVGGVNQAPVFTGAPGATTIFESGAGGTTGALAFTVTDPEGSPVAVTATSSNLTVIPASRVTVTGTTPSFAVTVTSRGVFGSSTITLSATDGNLTTTSPFVVTVSPSSVPSAPQNLAAVVTRNRVDFNWQAPASASTEPVIAYRLEAGFAPGQTVAVVPLGTALGYTVFNAPSGVFYARVRAQTPAGLGPASNEVAFATGQAAPPLAPQALLATVQGTGLALQWTENPLGPVIAGYQLHAGTGPGLSNIGVAPLPATQRTFAANAPPGTYYVRIVAVNAAGASPTSNEAVLVAQPGTCTIPSTPLGLVASVTSGRLNVAWNAPQSGAIPTGYTIQAGTTSGASNWGTFGLPPSPTAVSGIVPSGPYFIRLFAANACGTSGASSQVSVTVP
ncbi:MAG: fibronectin type III domain-containing protein [Vicinamibacterales bacterium]